jgi:N-acyl-D-amino-acid deacylase
LASSTALAHPACVTADIYPYPFGSPRWVLFPDRDFDNRSAAEFALREVVAPEDLLIVGFRKDDAYVGKTLADIAKLRNTDAPAAMMALIREAGDSGPTIVATSMDERDIARLMQWPWTNICSDGELAGGHPRGFGAFPRVLGRYVRERGVLRLEEAVRRMTTLAAQNVGIPDRGSIAPGQHADLVLFDPREIADRATTSNPHAMSVGISTVWVNGDVVFANGAVTGKYPGGVLRRASRN